MEVLAQIVAFLIALIAGAMSFVNPAIAYISEPFAPAEKSAQVLFVGDMMFDRTIRTAIEEKGGDHLFSCIDPLLLSADLVVGNLEGPITDYASISQFSKPRDENNFTFTFAPSTASLLFAHNIRLVNIGNNHIANFGREGIEQTKEWLRGAGVRYFGDPQSVEADRVARIEIDGLTFSFVNWSDWTSDKTDHTVAQVRTERHSGRVVVVYTHWGEEYVPATDRMKNLAHQFVDAGAEIVIGSHPHIIQEHEVYEGKHIYYSLGNFIFDQYWRDATRVGLVLAVQFGKDGVLSVGETRVSLERDRRTCPEVDEKD